MAGSRQLPRFGCAAPPRPRPFLILVDQVERRDPTRGTSDAYVAEVVDRETKRSVYTTRRQTTELDARVVAGLWIEWAELDARTEADVEALEELVEAGILGDWRRAVIRRRISELTLNSRQESGDA
jgi:hypothetical protein